MSLTAQLTAKSLAYASGIAKEHALGSMNSLVVITRIGAYDADLREYDTSGVQTLYDHVTVPGAGAMAGITSTSGPTTVMVGEETQYFNNIVVYVPQESPTKNLRIDDLVHVVSCPDNDIAGRTFRVTNVAVGGRIFSSIPLNCTGIAPSKQWSP